MTAISLEEMESALNGAPKISNAPPHGYQPFVGDDGEQLGWYNPDTGHAVPMGTGFSDVSVPGSFAGNSPQAPTPMGQPAAPRTISLEDMEAAFKPLNDSLREKAAGMPGYGFGPNGIQPRGMILPDGSIAEPQQTDMLRPDAAPSLRELAGDGYGRSPVGDKLGLGDFVPGADVAFAASDLRKLRERQSLGHGIGVGEKIGAYAAVPMAALGLAPLAGKAGRAVDAGIEKIGGAFSGFKDNAYQRVAGRTLDNANTKAGSIFSPLGDLPNQNAYLTERYRTLGKIARVDDIARDLNQGFARATPEDQKAAYQFLTTPGADPSAIKNLTTRTHAEKAKATIDRVGQELVKRGLLKQETFEANRGGYLPRIYLKHLMGEGTGAGAGQRLSDQGYLKARKDIPEDVRRIIMGEITDPGFLTARGMAQPSRDIAVMDFLDAVSKRGEWIFPESLVDWRGKKVSVPWLTKEAERLRAQAPYLDQSARAPAESLAMEADKLANAAIRKIGKVPAQYAQIPDNPRYGTLRGMHVRKEIRDDIVGAIGVMNPEANWAEKLLGQGGALTKATQAWKMSKVTLNPSAQIRNIVGNGVLLHLSGVSFPMVPIRLAQAAHDMATGGPAWQIAKDYGVAGTTFSANEILRIQRDFLNLKAKEGGGLDKIKAMAGAIVDGASNVYQTSEAIFKTAKIIDAMKKGATEAEAALEAHKWLFDYSLVPQSVRYLRNAPVGIPFATFYYKALPRLLEVAVKAPHRYLPYVLLPAALSESVRQTYDMTEGDLEALKMALPQWLQERGNAYLLPVKDEHGRWQAADIGYFFPWGMFQELAGEVAQGQAGQALGTTGLLGGPVPDLIAAVKTNVDPFTRKPITNPADPPEAQLADLMQYLWRLSAPTWLTDIGAAGKMYETLSEKVDPRTGDPKLTAGQSALRLLGVNVYPVDPERSRMQNMTAMNRDIQAIRQRMGRMLMDRNLTPEERDNVRESYTRLIRKRQEQLQDYANKSQLSPGALQ